LLHTFLFQACRGGYSQCLLSSQAAAKVFCYFAARFQARMFCLALGTSYYYCCIVAETINSHLSTGLCVYLLLSRNLFSSLQRATYQSCSVFPLRILLPLKYLSSRVLGVRTLRVLGAGTLRGALSVKSCSTSSGKLCSTLSLVLESVSLLRLVDLGGACTSRACYEL